MCEGVSGYFYKMLNFLEERLQTVSAGGASLGAVRRIWTRPVVLLHLQQCG